MASLSLTNNNFLKRLYPTTNISLESYYYISGAIKSNCLHEINTGNLNRTFSLNFKDLKVTNLIAKKILSRHEIRLRLNTQVLYF